jgi:glyceraldehyde 3-phosphate dehydrogenase
MINVGLNGFGRIGRAITRIMTQSSDFNLKVVNDLEPDVSNLAYLLKYDSIYGKNQVPIEVKEKNLKLGRNDIQFCAEEKITDVPWRKFDLDLIIEATGVSLNIIQGSTLIKSKQTRKMVVTNSDQNVDKTIVLSVNDRTYNPDNDHVVSASICDTNAIAPVLSVIDNFFGIEKCFITTLHPWLAYQNLLDGTLSSVASPGHNWKEYSLGRSSVRNLIPKDTTAGTATLRVLPHLKGKIDAISFRIPTDNVSASDFSILTTKLLTFDSVIEKFQQLETQYPNVFSLFGENLVSSDFSGAIQSCFVDKNRIRILEPNFIKINAWYDNEWAYANRVLDVCRLVMKQ